MRIAALAIHNLVRHGKMELTLQRCCSAARWTFKISTH